jgi:hypothetical protein
MRADLALRLAKKAHPGRRSLGLSDVRGYAAFGEGIADTSGSSADAGSASSASPSVGPSVADAMSTSDTGLPAVNANINQPSVSAVLNTPGISSSDVAAAAAAAIAATTPTKTLASLSLMEAALFSIGVSLLSHVVLRTFFKHEAAS